MNTLSSSELRRLMTYLLNIGIFCLPFGFALDLFGLGGGGWWESAEPTSKIVWLVGAVFIMISVTYFSASGLHSLLNRNTKSKTLSRSNKQSLLSKHPIITTYILIGIIVVVGLAKEYIQESNTNENPTVDCYEQTGFDPSFNISQVQFGTIEAAKKEHYEKRDAFDACSNSN